ncbi:amidohydrolase [Herbiconiux sp. A18JL235]|uniref:Amidohydrolase n=1 Tax=Herbiconiux sp. A18JL235 TaxID=3152363 RepID=A0AB39BHB9_9MICO
MTDGAPLIDSHLHLWDITSGGYAWLTPAAGALYDTFTADEAQAELAASGVTGAVLVQADDTDADTDSMLRVAAGHAWVSGMVGWVPLEHPAVAEARLEELAEHPVFCGVRHLVHEDPRDGFLELDGVRRSLAALARRGLAFDVPNAWPRHLDATAQLAAALPELTVVIDHLGKPPRGRDDFAAWRASFEAASRLPNTVAKVSGLDAPGQGSTADELREVWSIALEAFGPARMLWGSDWPVTTISGGYAETFGTLMSLVDELSADERTAVRGGTATRVYRLGRR